jgi:hypothetical protein
VRMILLTMLNKTTLKPHELRFHVLVRFSHSQVIKVPILGMVVVLESCQCSMVCDSSSRARTGNGSGAATTKGRQRWSHELLLTTRQSPLESL